MFDQAFKNYKLGNTNLLPQPNQNPIQLSSGINSMMSNIMNTNKQFGDFANQLKAQTQAYQQGFDKFNSQFESIMNDLLAKKNTSTGNIFNDFLTSYKSARESGVGSGLREGILSMLPNNMLAKMPDRYYEVNQGFDNSIHGKDF